MDKVELEVINFKNKDENDVNFPVGYEPLNADNLNKIQDNIRKSLNEIQDKIMFFAEEEEWEEC